MSTFPSPDWCAQESLFIPWSMCVNRPAVCVAVMLLLAVAHGKRACDYSVIISTYRAVVLVELQNLNLTGPFDISKEKDHCPSEKVHRILRDIYNMTQIFKCLSESKRQERDRADRGGHDKGGGTNGTTHPKKLLQTRKLGKQMPKSILQAREEAERKTAVENENDGKAHKLLAEAAECGGVLNHSKHGSAPLHII